MAPTDCELVIYCKSGKFIVKRVVLAACPHENEVV